MQIHHPLHIGIYHTINREMVYVPSLRIAVGNVSRAMNADEEEVSEIYAKIAEARIVAAGSASGSYYRSEAKKEKR